MIKTRRRRPDFNPLAPLPEDSESIRRMNLEPPINRMESNQSSTNTPRGTPVNAFRAAMITTAMEVNTDAVVTAATINLSSFTLAYDQMRR
jgi:hypothetical protein